MWHTFVVVGLNKGLNCFVGYKYCYLEIYQKTHAPEYICVSLRAWVKGSNYITSYRIKWSFQ